MRALPAAATPGPRTGALTERSAGKDTTTGHWEMAGIVLDRPFPTYPDGFPPEVIEPFEAADRPRGAGQRRGLGHRDHRASWARSTCEPAGPSSTRAPTPCSRSPRHVDVVPLEQLYEWCRIARGILDGPHRVGRVIARPFAGPAGAFVRTPGPPRLLRAAAGADGPGLAACGRGVAVLRRGQDRRHLRRPAASREFRYSRSNDDGVDLTLDYLSPARALAGVHEPRRLRLQVRAPQRPRGLRARASRRSTRACPSSSRPLRAAAGCCSSPATTGATRRRSRRPTTRASARRCSVGAAAGRGAVDLGTRPGVRRPGRDGRGRAGGRAGRRARRPELRRGARGGDDRRSWTPVTSSPPSATDGDGRARGPAAFVLGYARGEIPDYLAAAFLMAAYLRGLSDRRDRST